MKQSFFFDLDGTLLDIKEKHLELYRVVSQELNLNPLPQEQYWERKQKNVLPFIGIQSHDYERYRNRFKQLSEQWQFLKLDSCIPGIMAIVENLKQSSELVLLTKRHNKTNLLRQLEVLGLSSAFTHVLTPSDSKTQSLKSYGYSPRDVIIGDTEEDINTAKETNLDSIAVTWGLRSAAYLETLSPTYIISNPQELVTVLTG